MAPCCSGGRRVALAVSYRRTLRNSASLRARATHRMQRSEVRKSNAEHTAGAPVLLVRRCRRCGLMISAPAPPTQAAPLYRARLAPRRLSGQPAGGLLSAGGLQHATLRGARQRVAASSKPPPPGGGDRAGFDWDKSFKAFLKNAGLEPEKYVDRPPDPPGWNGRARADIRATENRVLAPWISTSFTKTSLAVVFAFAFFCIVVIGPPPSDGRCTLPWC